MKKEKKQIIKNYILRFLKAVLIILIGVIVVNGSLNYLTSGDIIKEDDWKGLVDGIIANSTEISSIKTKNSQQDTSITDIITVNNSQNTRLTTLESNTGSSKGTIGGVGSQSGDSNFGYKCNIIYGIGSCSCGSSWNPCIFSCPSGYTKVRVSSDTVYICITN